MFSFFKLKSSVMPQPQKHAYAIMWIPEITVFFYDLNCIKSPVILNKTYFYVIKRYYRRLSMNCVISNIRVGILKGLKK